MRARVARIRHALLGRVWFTSGGVLFTLAVVLVGAAALVSANNLLFLVLATMLSTLLVSGFVSRLCLAGLELDFTVPDHVSAKRTVSARLYVRNLKSWMPSFSIHVAGLGSQGSPPGPGSIRPPSQTPAILTSGLYFPVIPGGAVLEETVQVRFARRGPYRQNSFAFSTRFPFGFHEKTVRVTLLREVLVYPSIDSQPGFEELLTTITGEIETHYQGLGKDFYRIRPYQAFESARHVDWKATAHTGDLQVREFAREQERTVEMFLDLDVPEGMEAWFDLAVDCCAYLAWRLSQKATGIRFRTQDFDFRLPEEGDIYTILRYLALVSPLTGKPVPSPADETGFQIVLTAAPHRFAELGWTSAHMVGPDAFPDSAAVAAAG
jgi:uncharacterized protein (DUF58 family)